MVDGRGLARALRCDGLSRVGGGLVVGGGWTQRLFHCGHSLGRRMNRRGKRGEDGGGEWLILAGGRAAVVALGFCGAMA